jgi:quinol monooxygenase YgiN
MSTKVITVVASFQAKPGEEKALREVLTALVEPTKKEDGCLEYDLHVSCDNPAKFLFHENWVTKAHLDVHAASPHLQELPKKLEGLCLGQPEITLWEKIA